jgi:hypothetical protein
MQSAPEIELVPLVSGLDNPVYVGHAGEGSGRLFIVEQPGRIKVLQPGSSRPTLFLDITIRVRFGGERGLLGLAFHPRFESNRRFFVDYTRAADGATVIAEYRASASNPNVADPTETILLVIEQPFANHNGGMIEFGRDGFLYIAMGDGGSANDPGNRAQNPGQLLGKILRIDIDTPSGGAPYSSPPDNPFFGDNPGRDEIFALGMRNPWRFSFDRITGDLYAGDVGQNAREEIDIITLGGNYGWRVFEGTSCTGNDSSLCSPGSFRGPITEYSHSGGRCSVTGGYVYRGSRQSLPFGSYVFADFCSGEIFLFRNGQQSLLLDTSLNISSFGEDEAGEIYVVNLGGSISRITNPDAPPLEPFSILSAHVRSRKTEERVDPVTPKNNGKKFEIIVFESASSPRPASKGSIVLVNGVDMKTKYTLPDIGLTPIFVARLKRPTLSAPGNLVIEVVRPDGNRSNQLVIPVVAATQ